VNSRAWRVAPALAGLVLAAGCGGSSAPAASGHGPEVTVLTVEVATLAGVEVAGVGRPRVDDDAGIGAEDVGVGPFQRHRPRVGGDDAKDLGVAGGELCHSCSYAAYSRFKCTDVSP